MLSTLTGLARQVLVAGAFGTQADIDAFNAANRAAETMFVLVAGGALASAFIPTFTALLVKENRRGAWRLASATANLIVVVMVAAIALGEVFAPQVVRYLLAPGFVANPSQEALTVALMRLMLPSALIFGLSGLSMGILNAHRVFFIPALAPAMYQLGLIFGVVVLAPYWGVYGLGWGVLAGAACHLALQLPALRRLRGAYTFTLGLEDAAVRQTARLLGPRLLGLAVVQLNFWVNTWLASQMEEGSIAALVLAFALMLMPQAAIAQATAIAAMPTFAAQYALGRLDELRAGLAASLRGVLLLALPASLGLMLLSTPIIVLFYQRGEFDAHSTGLVAWALVWYALGLVAHSLMEVLARTFYALQDTRTPVAVGTAAMLLNVVFSFTLPGVFVRLGWSPHGGLALANTLATALETAALFYLMRRRLNGLEGRRLWSGAAQALAAGLCMSLALGLWLAAFAGRPAWWTAGGGVLLGMAVYAAAAWLLGIEEMRRIVRFILTRLSRTHAN